MDAEWYASFGGAQLRTRAIILAALSLSSMFVSAEAMATQKKKNARCTPSHPHAFVANAHAVVYLGYEEIEACAYGYRRSYIVGSLPYGDAVAAGGVFDVTLAGATLAYEEFRSYGGNEGPDTEKNLVVVRDLRSGRILHRVPTGVPAKPQRHGETGIGRTTGLVVKNDGAVAWIVSTAEELGGYQVHAVDNSGSRVLASGENIDPSSLALVGSRLYWMQGGVPASAVLH